MVKKTVLILLLVLGIACTASAGQRIANWKSWAHFPEVPIIEASMVADLLLHGEKMLLIYGGYEEIEDVICGSIFLPAGVVPPYSDGSTVNLPDIPKDTLMLVY